jgi:hypothetical protein
VCLLPRGLEGQAELSDVAWRGQRAPGRFRSPTQALANRLGWIVEDQPDLGRGANKCLAAEYTGSINRW